MEGSPAWISNKPASPLFIRPHDVELFHKPQADSVLARLRKRGVADTRSRSQMVT